MHSLWNTFLKGLIAILPVGLTLYLVYWLGATIEKALRMVVTGGLSRSGLSPQQR